MSPTRSPAEGGISINRRVLILHVRAGAGHERAARAVAQAMREIDSASDPMVLDALEFATPLMRWFYASSYNRMVARAPRMWGEVYRRSEVPYRGRRQRGRTWLTMALCRGFLSAAERLRPDVILCTQFLPSEVFGTLRAQGKLRVPVYTAITDFSVHPIWVYGAMDRYFVATEDVREELEATGEVPRDRVAVTGVPIDPRFAISIPQAEARRALELDPDPSRPVFLLMGGGFGWGPIEGMLEVVLSLPEHVQALVIAGRNVAMREALAKRARGLEGRIKVHGFTDRVDLFLAASDLIVGKSGGLTCSEAMARGVPMAIFRPIPGQEERNCDYLQESGAAVRVHDFEDLRQRLTRFLTHPELLKAMRAKAEGIGRPRSAYDVAKAVMRHE